MKAIVLKNKGVVELGEMPIPELKDNSVKIAISYCGLCGSDLHKVDGRKTVRPLVYPVILGHEISGVVDDVGKNVKNFKKGDRVTVDPNWSCGECYYCKNNMPTYCNNSKGVVKGMADYICPPQENVYHIEDSLPLLDAVLTEPISCCLHGVDLLNIKPNSVVAIVGFGAIGTIMLQLIKLQGVKDIIVLDIDDEKKEKAIKLGATRYINPTNHNYLEEIKNYHIDNVMECVGSTHTFKTCVDIACKGATIVLFGMSKPEDTVPFNTYEFLLKELTIKGSFLNYNTTQRAIDILTKKQIDIENTIAKVITPEEMVQEINNRQLLKQGKVIVKWEQ